MDFFVAFAQSSGASIETIFRFSVMVCLPSVLVMPNTGSPHDTLCSGLDTDSQSPELKISLDCEGSVVILGDTAVAN